MSDADPLETICESLRRLAAIAHVRGEGVARFVHATIGRRAVEVCPDDEGRYSLECWHGDGPSLYELEVPSLAEAVHEAGKWLTGR